MKCYKEAAIVMVLHPGFFLGNKELTFYLPLVIFVSFVSISEQRFGLKQVSIIILG
ncbi:hypothetical protein [Dulcicalothrix desertica]|uniref:hypothetical protein n=1 Tax=Dulcicalothrix desertica TaxID=32056 RepID=UPI00119BB593|nr:hypothetical protein [Dulcicalothrix desertica]TWH40188.1 hypothetical protein CAL7102_09491 [Dulcicalothrix desertica PCC 7102]